MKLKLFIITTVLMFVTLASFSQGTFVFRIGPTIPMGDFGDDDARVEDIRGLKAGGAGIVLVWD